ncbi:MAG: hypothetical protein OXG24_03480 [Gammaproteobacteria bacterium]|nr:hypothetical protein [Gammaproteobacteria bacterium]
MDDDQHFVRELIHRCRFTSRKEAAEKVDAYFLRIYNPLRRAPLVRGELEQIAQMKETN